MVTLTLVLPQKMVADFSDINLAQALLFKIRYYEIAINKFANKQRFGDSR